MTATLTDEKYDAVTEALKDVMDPELGINVVDLGLIYDLAWDDENDALVIHMTLTSAGCPLTDVLEDQTAQALDSVVDRFRINWVWMPPWGPERITDDGRDMMRALGFAIRVPFFAPDSLSLRISRVNCERSRRAIWLTAAPLRTRA